MTETEGRHIAILGGGVIGSSIAYHITLLNRDPNLKVTVIEQTAIASAASGRAGYSTSICWVLFIMVLKKNEHLLLKL